MAPRRIAPLAALVASLDLVLAVKYKPGKGRDVDDPCRCLNWKEVYSTKRAWCGEYGEIADMTSGSYAPSLGQISKLYGSRKAEMDGRCTEFLEKLDDNGCFPYFGKEDDREYPHGWCYVSERCYNLGSGMRVADKVIPGGMTIKRDIAARGCSLRDSWLDRNFTTEEFFEVAKKSKLDFGNAIRQLYPWRWGTFWMTFEGTWNNLNYTLLGPPIVDYVASGRPQLFPARFKKTNEMVVLRRNKIWDVYRAPKRCPETTFCLELRDEATMPLPADFKPMAGSQFWD